MPLAFLSPRFVAALADGNWPDRIRLFALPAAKVGRPGANVRAKLGDLVAGAIPSSAKHPTPSIVASPNRSSRERDRGRLHSPAGWRPKQARIANRTGLIAIRTGLRPASFGNSGDWKLAFRDWGQN